MGEHEQMAGVPTWFGPAERPLFGWAHVPKNARARGVAVFCHPLGREAANALPAVRVAGAQAAATGIAALRFDYAGTGDSAGHLTDPDRVSDWLDSIDQAVALARTMCPGPVILVGLRAGALLATASCNRGTTVDGLVLWDPSPSGPKIPAARANPVGHRFRRAATRGRLGRRAGVLLLAPDGARPLAHRPSSARSVGTADDRLRPGRRPDHGQHPSPVRGGRRRLGRRGRPERPFRCVPRRCWSCPGP